MPVGSVVASGPGQVVVSCRSPVRVVWGRGPGRGGANCIMKMERSKVCFQHNSRLVGVTFSGL